MDRIDRAIIDQLRRDGRQSNLELAEAVGLTPSPCLRRVKRLEETGVIRGYHASVAPEAIDRGFEVFVGIELKELSPEINRQFESELIAHDEVVEARRMFGAPDFEVVVATKDLAAYNLFVSAKLMALPGIGKIHSRFPMLSIKSDTGTQARAAKRPR